MAERPIFDPALPPEQRIVRLFEAADHDVTERVATQPGAVDRFATPRTGLVRPRTYWVAWSRCPPSLDAALAQLDADRQALGADRGLGVVLEGSLPEGYQTDLVQAPVSAITLRRLALELSGIAEELRRVAASTAEQARSALFLDRRGDLDGGEVVDAVAHLVSWVQGTSEKLLHLRGAAGTGKASVLQEALYRIAGVFTKDPERVTPLVAPIDIWTPVQRGLRSIRRELLHAGLIVEHGQAEDRIPPSGRPGRCIVATEAVESPALTLRPPEPADFERWYRAHLRPATFERFFAARAEFPDFASLTQAHSQLTPMNAAMSKTQPDGIPIEEWVARVILEYVRYYELEPAVEKVLTRASIEEFGLGSSQAAAEIVRDPYRWYGPVSQFAALSIWLKTDSVSQQGVRSREATFANRLIWHYFIARKIADELGAGNPEILTRYQFPQRFVLLFLALIAPKAAAQATADRSLEIQAQIQTEAERQLELVLAHHLRRSAGAIRSHIKKIRRRLAPTERDSLQHEFSRIDEEINFQSALVEQVQKWHQPPDAPPEALSVGELLSATLTPLQEAYRLVKVDTEAASSLRVQANRESLREILHNLLENAFHAVAYADAIPSPAVKVRAYPEGQGGTIRIDVMDNGPGVAPDDRERIFEQRVTTKKGGDGKPLGTGMGLAIARRWAERMGGHVGFDPASAETCFFVRLVAAKESV